MVEYISSKEAVKKLGVCRKTLQEWAKKGKIDHIKTNGGWRKYNIEPLLRNKNNQENETRKNICYARVSTSSQKEELNSQISYLEKEYPKYELITDIGSGINFKRKGIQKIIDLAINNELENLIITYKDRLCRIGYNLIEYILKKYSNTNIVILNTPENSNEELTNDLLEIITVYSSKLHGKRSYKL